MKPLWPHAIAGVFGGALIGFVINDTPGAIIGAMVGFLFGLWQHSRFL